MRTKQEAMPGRTKLKQHTLDGGVVSVAIFAENQRVAHVIGGKQGTVTNVSYNVEKGWVYTVQFGRQGKPKQVIEGLLVAVKKQR